MRWVFVDGKSIKIHCRVDHQELNIALDQVVMVVVMSRDGTGMGEETEFRVRLESARGGLICGEDAGGQKGIEGLLVWGMEGQV